MVNRYEIFFERARFLMFTPVFAECVGQHDVDENIVSVMTEGRYSQDGVTHVFQPQVISLRSVDRTRRVENLNQD